MLVIAHISGSLEEMMRERLDGCPGKRSDRLPNGTQPAQQDVWVIPIGLEAEFAAEFSQPKHGFGRPMLSQGEDELSSYQDESENTAHAFDRVDAQIFDIQALLLVKAIRTQ
jgi:hypothetical protein